MGANLQVQACVTSPDFQRRCLSNMHTTRNVPLASSNVWAKNASQLLWPLLIFQLLLQPVELGKPVPGSAALSHLCFSGLFGTFTSSILHGDHRALKRVPVVRLDRRASRDLVHKVYGPITVLLSWLVQLHGERPLVLITFRLPLGVSYRLSVQHANAAEELDQVLHCRRGSQTGNVDLGRRDLALVPLGGRRGRLGRRTLHELQVLGLEVVRAPSVELDGPALLLDIVILQSA
mmetsp:Transcript_2998/g.9044  ORF Transcript_2998/g.9044 Transcript_2998/m.9044 type:complete len:234 (-) Transcript_2998:279-980(-)